MCEFCDDDRIEDEDIWEVCALYMEMAGNWHGIALTVEEKKRRDYHPDGPREWWPDDVKKIFLVHILEVCELAPDFLKNLSPRIVEMILATARQSR